MLPQPLSQAIAKELSTVSLEALQCASNDLSKRYASGGFIQSQNHRLAYISARLPATYAVVTQIFDEIYPYLENVNTFMDLGAGIGSSLWATSKSYHRTLYEKDQALIQLGQRLIGDHFPSNQITWIHDDITSINRFPKQDMTLISYVLNELNENAQRNLIQRAYHATSQLLILIEPGTPKGFGNILEARKNLIELGAQILAPCPHLRPCPLMQAFEEKKDWCHFSVRVPREDFHKRVKKGSLDYEDEKYCYLVVSPTHTTHKFSRIIKAPIRKSGHVILDLCTPEGVTNRKIITKKTKRDYMKARNTRWGDNWFDEHPIDDSQE